MLVNYKYDYDFVHMFSEDKIHEPAVDNSLPLEIQERSTAIDILFAILYHTVSE